MKLKVISARIKRKMSLSRGIRKLKPKDLVASFVDEGGVTISLPRPKQIDLFSKRRTRFAENTFWFEGRPQSEVLLRKIVHELYNEGILDRKKSVIDIGAWIGDNAIVWSRTIDEDHSIVFAIDPSADNIEFAQEICQLNGVTNISWHEKVCSEAGGEKLFFDGSIDHATFDRGQKKTRKHIESTTIDDIVGSNYHDKIGLFHVDVEGFEESVLLGSTEVISKSRPIILFEQHISTEVMDGIFSLLRRYDYKVFMINEVMPGTHPDCRNFLAAQTSVDLSPILSKDLVSASTHKVYSAFPGPCLVSIE